MNELKKLDELEKLEFRVNYLEESLKDQDLSGYGRDWTEKEIKKVKREIKEIQKSLGVSVIKNTINTFDGLDDLLSRYPENRRRPVNKVIHGGSYFNLVYNLNERKIIIKKKDEIIFSAIPYDTARNYIQKAAILTLLHPESTIEYIKNHKPNLMTYIKQSLRQVGKSTNLANHYYQEIFNYPLFMMQILGRMLQHEETGPLSANLPGKFLYDVNQNTGITGYLVEFLKFVVESTIELPIATDGERVNLVENFKNGELINSVYAQAYISSYSIPHLSLLPAKSQIEIKKELMTVENSAVDLYKPMLRSNVGIALSNVRKNYVAHSIHPSTLEPLFTNILMTRNNNLINVVSDIHSINGKIPFQNDNFNIIAGDLSDSVVEDMNMEGIIVIGNHELSNIVNNDTEKESEFDDYRDEYWFKKLVENPDESWPYLPIGNSSFYDVIKLKLSSRFPNMSILNNEVFYYQDIRYIGLTVPVALVKRKLESQQFMYKTLKRLLCDDNITPTIIVSHAPLFNELSMLSPKSSAYNADNFCSLKELLNIFKENNIIGAIHGHHHISASRGREKNVEFVGKKFFVVCSIYSKMNTGLELQSIINQFVKQSKGEKYRKSPIAINHLKKLELITYKHDTNIDDIANIYREKKGNKTKFTVEKTIARKRYRKRFDNINDAIDYLNALNIKLFKSNE
ncbi:metallophosphoesterase family protein [Breznakia pachnodae]|uniref:Calcineurin-like phosphoesterase domain-containing protein n=1 Tax=Breznakia pachnodae TaxID=265178 RepID=A0ABU0E5D4_9FIRM|nr:metallophosphoesterase [Breznakia pachnodae]MDQ0362109.1 hypothetical protein [Breznakia pachnodae]